MSIADSSAPDDASSLRSSTRAASVLVIPVDPHERAFLTAVPSTNTQFFSRLSELMDEADVDQLPVHVPSVAADTAIFVDNSQLQPVNARALQFLELAAGRAGNNAEDEPYAADAVRGTVVISGQFTPGQDGQEDQWTDAPGHVLGSFSRNIDPVRTVAFRSVPPLGRAL